MFLLVIRILAVFELTILIILKNDQTVSDDIADIRNVIMRTALKAVYRI